MSVTSKKLLALVFLAVAVFVGLVSTEGTMVALLQRSGIAQGAASAGTLVMRLTALWFAVAVVLVALACFNKVRSIQSPVADSGEPDRQFLQVPS